MSARAIAVAVGLVAWFAIGWQAAAGEVRRPAVVELYTSEGCSSCPPADALLEELSARADVLPIAFHVDYWDSAEWRDRFALRVAAERQQRLARALGLASVGTPQFFVDGRRSVTGADRDGLLRALLEPRTTLELDAQLIGANLVITLPADATRGSYDVLLASYLPRVLTPIAQGENAGRQLTEVNVVRSYRSLGHADSRRQQWTIAVASMPRESSRALVWLQRPASGPIDAAVSLPLR